MYRLNKYYTLVIVAGVICPNIGRMLGHSVGFRAENR
jgi:hypothetical protein